MRVGFAIAGIAALGAAAALAPGKRALVAGTGSRAAQDAPAALPDARPCLVVVTIDTLRADHLGCYGYFRPTSPFIDALAKESILFERCFAPIPHTTPSHASLFTGVHPIEHGITQNSWLAPQEVKRARSLVTTPQLKTCAQVLKEHGFATGGFVTAATVARITGLAEGFDAWTEPAGDRRPGREALDEARKWLGDVAGRPFFLWVHLFDVHGPHKKGDPWETYKDLFPEDDGLREWLARRGIKPVLSGRGGNNPRPPAMNCRYDSALRFTDDLVAELVAALKSAGAWERTVFVLTGDHGEGLGEHDFLGHELAWGEQLQVPLLVRAPGRSPAKVEHGVSLVDVLPTLIDLAPELPREELLAQASGGSALSEDFEPRPLFAIAAAEKEFALTAGRFKFVRRVEGGDALYDLEADPFELRDVAAEHAKVAELLGRRLEILRELQEKRRDWLRVGGVEPEITPDDERKWRDDLHALGYGD